MAAEGFAAPWVEFEKFLGARPLLHGPTVENCFKDWDNLGQLLMANITTWPTPEQVEVENREIEGGLKVRIYTPPNHKKGSNPICFYIHGGGWAMGDLEADDPDCRVICKRAQVVVVAVDYRLSTVAKYPAGLDDCLNAFTWTVKNSESLGGTPGKAFIAGASAGGGSSFGLALRLIDDGRKDEVVGIVGEVPCLIHPDAVPEKWRSKYTSYDEHAEHTVNTNSAMRAFWDAYGSPAKDKYANPLLHDRLAELPRTYITYCGQDTLRDDARLMIDEIKANGGEVKFDEFKGYPHYYWTFPAPCLKDAQKEYHDKLIAGIKYVLE
ncbi:alpha/beta-hydrolase [Microthyrium microscopicum]|uniref:Alpha/beta-hydrolase n=1 Tax=Microthyrium microscopicum TaxID=703497 RepID=A0A6A6UAY7_9PEZI|nr:alpha/beta-hydrolase [Microthyrium microscopicum]